MPHEQVAQPASWHLTVSGAGKLAAAALTHFAFAAEAEVAAIAIAEKRSVFRCSQFVIFVSVVFFFFFFVFVLANKCQVERQLQFAFSRPATN